VPDVSPVVCLVDDDPSVRKSVTRLLESSGFSVNAFSEPEAFLGHLTAHSVPVAVLDIWMNKITGMVLLAHLCARSPKTRVIFITGREDHAAETTVKQAGAFAFFLKPFDNKRFLAAVRDAFDQTSSKKREGRNSNPSERRPLWSTEDGDLLHVQIDRSPTNGSSK
jgi:FixJ family two-component response regulator